MALGQAADDLQQRLGLVDDFDWAIGVHRQVVPGGDHLGVVGLAGVIARADIGVGTGEHQQRFSALLQVLPLNVGPGQVRVDRAKLALLGVDQDGQVGRQQAVFTMADEDGEARIGHVPVQAC
ncbi:hypothetical protein D3C80_1274120 [compost metagenome]